MYLFGAKVKRAIDAPLFGSASRRSRAWKTIGATFPRGAEIQSGILQIEGVCLEKEEILIRGISVYDRAVSSTGLDTNAITI